MVTSMIKKKTNMSIRRQIGYWLLGMYVTLSISCVLFLFIPMMYFYFRPLVWDVEYISIKPITVEVGKPLWFESTRHNKTEGTNIFADTLVCVDNEGNVILNEASQTLRSVSAQPGPKTAIWMFEDGKYIASRPFENCQIKSTISRVRPFVGIVTQRLDSPWFRIE